MTTRRPAPASLLLVLALLVGAAGCADTGGDGPDADPADADAADGAAAAASTVRTATARLEPTEGSDVRGTATFTPTGRGVRVTATVTGLAEGAHGFHVHETGDCSAPDGSSAGGHFAPEGSDHGGPDEAPPDAHVGDFGNLTAGPDGRATFDEAFEDVALEGARGIAGRALIVHAEPDDLTSQPSGDAGDRMACGVVRIDGA